MAVYRKTPVEFDVPSNADKQGYSFVPFTGLEINENPVLNSASSASDMLNMVVDDDFFLTLRPRLIEDEEYNACRQLVIDSGRAINARITILDSLVLRQGLYLFRVTKSIIGRPTSREIVIGENGYIISHREIEVGFFVDDFDTYVISRDGDSFRFVSKIEDNPKMVTLSRSEEGWGIVVDEPHIPTYRGIVTQSVNLLEQPVFEDLNILTTKYKLSVLYDENSSLEIGDFYTSAEVIDGTPYFVDVSVAGLDEEEGIEVYGDDLIISKFRSQGSGEDSRDPWLVEIYNATDHDIIFGAMARNNCYLAIDNESEEHISLFQIYRDRFPSGTPTIRKGETWIIHNSLSLYNDYPTTINDSLAFYIYPNDFRDSFSTSPVCLCLKTGPINRPPKIVDSLYRRIPALPINKQMERAPQIRNGIKTWVDEYTINPFSTTDWILSDVDFLDITGLGYHDIITTIYGDGSYLGSGQKAVCYESASYSLFYDYQDVLLKVNANDSDFSFDVRKVDHVTKIISVFTIINVVSDFTGTNDYIEFTDFKRLWNANVFYDANSNPIHTLHYDGKSGKFIRANYKELEGESLGGPLEADDPIGTRRGENMTYPVGVETEAQRGGKYWRTRFNDIVYYIPESAGASYYNNMDLDMPVNMLDEVNYTYSNTNYLRNYYFDGVLVTVHSGTWGQGYGNENITSGAGIRNLGLAMVVTNLTTLDTIKIIGGDSIVGNPINHHAGDVRVWSAALSTFHIVPQRCVYDLNTPINNDFIKGVIYNDAVFAILASVELNGVFTDVLGPSSSYDYKDGKTYFYHIDNNILDPDGGVDISEYFGVHAASLLGSREIGIRTTGTQVVVFNYNEDGFILSDTPLFYIMTVMLNASKVLDITGSKLATEYFLLNLNNDNSGNIRLIAQRKDIDDGKKVTLAVINLEKTIASGRLVYNNLDIAESMYITETSELLTGGFMIFSERDGYYYYGPLGVSKNEIIFTYDLENNTRNVLRLDEDMIKDYYAKRKEWIENSESITGDRRLMGVSEMLDSRVYYKRNYLFLTYPDKPNYIPLVNVMKTKRTVRSATSYLQQLGVVYEENNVEYLQIAENPFVESDYLMHTYIPRLTSVEQPAIDYLENKTLLTFIGLTVYLNESGLFGLNFDADTPQDDQRKATLLSKVVNKRLLKYDLSTAFLSNYDPYVLITIPQGAETHVFAYKIDVNHWFFWKLPIAITKIDGDNFKSRFHFGDNKVAMFTDDPITLETDAHEYHGAVERYLDFDKIPISWFWKSQILSLGSITRRKQITDTYFVFVNNNANVVLDEEQNFDIVERQVTTQGFGLRYLTFKDTVDIAPRVEYEQELNIINNLRKRTYLNRFNYCQLLCYNIDKDNPVQDKVRIANIIITYKLLTGGR